MEERIERAIAEGATLLPIADFPCAPRYWRIGFFYDGKPHPVSKAIFDTYIEAEMEILKIHAKYGDGNGKNGGHR